ncbi:hypothetical protein V2J09_017493 [Rumex salicifolius]
MEVLPVMIVFFVLVCFRCDAATDPQEVMSLQEMYRALNFSPQLVGWKAENRDPWTGISCAGSSVLNMNLTHNMLSGPMGNVFTGLPSLGEIEMDDQLMALLLLPCVMIGLVVFWFTMIYLVSKITSLRREIEEEEEEAIDMERMEEIAKGCTECVICLCQYEDDDVPRRTLKPCGHRFHKICIDTWFYESRRRRSLYRVHRHRRCPLCRVNI